MMSSIQEKHAANNGVTDARMRCVYRCISGKPVMAITGFVLLRNGIKVDGLL